MRTVRGVAVAALVLGVCAGAAGGQERVVGSMVPEGPPRGEVVRVEAGDACVIDLVQGYAIEGGLTGHLEIDYRIFVAGPCGSPPGAFEEHWIARGTFEGAVSGRSATASFWYRAEVAAGGVVDGSMGFAGDVSGSLSVTGRFSDGRLAHQGSLARVDSGPGA